MMNGEHGYLSHEPSKVSKETIALFNQQSKTDPPQFAEPDFSYKFDELTEDQKARLYKRPYNMKMTKKEVLKVSGLGFLSLLALVLIGSMLVRLLVEIAVWGYTLFGLW